MQRTTADPGTWTHARLAPARPSRLTCHASLVQVRLCGQMQAPPAQHRPDADGYMLKLLCPCLHPHSRSVALCWAWAC